MALMSLNWTWPRATFADDWNEADHPRIPAGGPGGGEFESAGGGGTVKKPLHPKTPGPEFAKEPAKGTSDERTRIRLRMKVTSDKAERKLLREKMKQSYLLSHAAAVKSGNEAKALQYEASLAKMGVKVQNESSQPGYVSNYAEYKNKYLSPASGNTINPSSEAMEKVAPAGQSYYEKYKNSPPGVPGYSPKPYLPTPESNPGQNMPPVGAYDKYSDTQMIKMYTGAHYRGINKGLREGSLTPDQWQFTKGVNRGLDKLPPYEGTVYRKVADMDGKIFSTFQPGTIVEERGFMSTSKNINVWGGDTKFTIASKTGRSVVHISSHKSEQEVLFKSGSRFFVKKVDPAKKIVHMEEVT
jgi:hypothetical protein